MIAASRFVETSTNHEAWIAARKGGVTATEVAKAATPAGMRDALEQRRNPVETVDNAYMQFGREQEPVIAAWVKKELGIMPNSWLIAAGGNPQHMATPDGLSLDHFRIAEIKTTGKDLTKPPLVHVRQMQWQMYCTGTERSFYVWMLRDEIDGAFVPAWWEPKVLEVPRDERMIADLIETANELIGGDTHGF